MMCNAMLSLSLIKLDLITECLNSIDYIMLAHAGTPSIFADKIEQAAGIGFNW